MQFIRNQLPHHPRPHETMIQSTTLRAAAVIVFAFALIPLVAAEDATVVAESRLAEILGGDTPETIGELRALQEHVQQLVERALPATVSLSDASGVSSGVLVRRDDRTYVLCAAHVTRSAGRSIAIRMTDGTELQGVTSGADHRSDVGLVQVDTEVEYPAVEIGASTDLKRGQWVLMLGHPSGRKPGRTAPVRLGRVLHVPKSGYLITDCTMQAGDSGGPLLDMNGRVVGINSRNSPNLAVNLHAPIDALVKHWAELHEGKVTQPSRLAAWTTTVAIGLGHGRSRSLAQGDAMREVWTSVAARVNPSVVRVLVGDEERALGTAVAPDLVVTKYSGIADEDDKAKRTCRQGENTWPYSIVGIDRPADLALLRIVGGRLEPIAWHEETPSAVSLLASPDGDAEPIGIGVLSAAPYRHTPPHSLLGARFANSDEGPAELDDAIALDAAYAAGLQAGDVVMRFGQERVDNAQQLLELISQRRPGEKVRVAVNRDGAEITFDVTLGTNREPFLTKQEHVWGPLSDVRSGFDTILQHDTVLKPEHCGGPLIDLDGRAIGLNIARAGRVETLALPASEVQRLVASLLTASQQAKQTDGAARPAADGKTILVTRGHEGWHYWDEAERPSEAWNTGEFDDSVWDTGAAPLGYGVDGVATTISFGEDNKNKHAAAFFRLTFHIDDPKAHPAWLGELRCDDGAVVYLNGREIYRYNMPKGDLSRATFAAATVSSYIKPNYHAFYLDGGHLEAGKNVLAISVHQANSASSDLVMDFALNGVADARDPDTKPLHSDGVLESDKAISNYIDRWAKHLLKQDRAPIPSRFVSVPNRILDREVELIEPTDTPLSPEKLYERCAPGVLILSAVGETERFPPVHGSGFIVSADGLALTNHHVMRNLGGADLVVATTLSGRVVRVKEILATNQADDLALIQLDGEGFHPLPIAKSARVGSDLVTISHPVGSLPWDLDATPINAFFTLTRGQLARHTRDDNGRPRIMATSEWALGSSGAPIFDRFGRVAGVVSEFRPFAYRVQRLHAEGDVLKLGKGDPDRGLFLPMGHQMTLGIGIPCQSLHAFLTPLPLGPAQKVEAPNPGLNWQLYEGRWSALPDFATLKPTGQGTCESPANDVHGDRDDEFALVFTGFIDLPRDGVWQFRTTSDDGSRLYIDDERVVDNDGVHAAVSRSGYRRLAAGLHAIRIEYFDHGGPDELKLHFSGPDQPWTEIPASAFRRR